MHITSNIAVTHKSFSLLIGPNDIVCNDFPSAFFFRPNIISDGPTNVFFDTSVMNSILLSYHISDAMKTTLTHKAKENDALLSSMYGMLGDTRLGLMKSGCLPLDWASLWKTSPAEETGLLEIVEKVVANFGK